MKKTLVQIISDGIGFLKRNKRWTKPVEIKGMNINAVKKKLRKLYK